MANVTITQLPAALTPLSGTELVPIVQNGQTVKAAVSAIGGTGGGTVSSVNVSGGATGLTTSGGPITGSGTITLGGTLAIASGGTSATTAAGARTNILPSYVGNGGKVLAVNGGETDVNWIVTSGTGTVQSVSVSSANGLAGTVANATTTPNITLSTTVTGVLKGNGTAISAATANTDYQFPITLTTTGTSGAATFNGYTLNIPQYSSGGGTPAGSDKQIQYNASGSFGASANFTWDGFTLFVGGGSAIGALTNPIAAFIQSSPNYIQTYTHNDNSGVNASSDFVVYPDNGTDSSCWGDFGITSSGFADAAYSVTGPNETYLFASGSAGKTGNLVYATDSNGTANAHQWYVGGFTQAKGAWKMQLTSTGLQLANALTVAYGGTGATTLTGILKGNGTSAFTAATAGTDYQAPITLTTTGTSGAATFVGNTLNIPQYTAGGGSGTVTSVSVVNANGFSGSVATATTTPAITITTGVSGLLKGNGTAVSAASSGTDYAPGTSALATGILKSTTSTGALSIAVAADFPTLNQNTTGTASNVTGTVAIANGGTGQINQQSAINALTGTQVSGRYLRSDGSNATLAVIQAADVPTLNQNTTGTASNVTGTVAIANGGTGQTTASAGFNALSPITTTGDIIIGNGTNSATRLGIGSNTYVLTSNGTTATWAAPTGGSGTPGGSNTQIQFNNSGAFGGSANFTWDGSNIQVGLQGAVRFADADSSNYVAFRGPATVASNVTWTLPSIDGTSGQVLQTSGTGTLSWVTQSGGGGGSPNLDGGIPSSNYGGITAINGGTP